LINWADYVAGHEVWRAALEVGEYVRITGLGEVADDEEAFARIAIQFMDGAEEEFFDGFALAGLGEVRFGGMG